MAAVVGVITSLALLFTYYVFWYDGYAGRLEWPAAVLAVSVTTPSLHIKAKLITVGFSGGQADQANKITKE